jgi:sialic acid synthase SpsE
MLIISDPGSTHHGSYDNAEKHVLLSAQNGFWACKFQLCYPDGGNIPIEKEWLRDLVNVGKKLSVRVSASIWDEAGLEAAEKAGCQFVKFAYSQSKSELIKKAVRIFGNVFVTYGYMDNANSGTSRKIELWTVTDSAGCVVYPVVSPVTHTHVMYERFGGFSCHSLDPYREMLEAKDAGARFFEFHTRLGLPNDFDVLDGRFAAKYAKGKI